VDPRHADKHPVCDEVEKRKHGPQPRRKSAKPPPFFPITVVSFIQQPRSEKQPNTSLNGIGVEITEECIGILSGWSEDEDD